MHWGRVKRGETAAPVLPPRRRAAAAAAVLGACLTAASLSGAVLGVPTPPASDPTVSAAAIEAFGRAHAALTALLGLDEAFPRTVAVMTAETAAGPPSPPPARTFGEYLADALRAVLGGDPHD